MVVHVENPLLFQQVNSLKNSGSIGHKSGLSNRHRKPTQSTTAAPLINTFPSTVAIYRNGKPIETTFSSRIDLVGRFMKKKKYDSIILILFLYYLGSFSIFRKFLSTFLFFRRVRGYQIGRRPKRSKDGCVRSKHPRPRICGDSSGSTAIVVAGHWYIILARDHAIRLLNSSNLKYHIIILPALFFRRNSLRFN